MVLSESGLRGHFDRTKTSGAGRKVRFLPFFISSEAWLVSRRWLELGFRIWKGSEFSFKRDFLVPRPTRNLQGCRPVLASYNDLATASRMVLSLLRAPAYYEGDWFLTDELRESGVLRVFTEHSERSCMSTLAAWAGIDRERRDYLGRWHIVESADVYVRSAWRVVSSLQMYLVNALLETAELRKVGLSEVQERLQDNGLGADDARALCEGLQAPSDWASWRSVHITARPPLPRVDKPAPEPAPVQESKGYKFYVSVLGKRSLRRLHRKGGCGTKPEDLIRCEFYETIEGVEFDAECKHCFDDDRGDNGRRRLVRRLTELRGDDGCGDDGAAPGCTVAEGVAMTTWAMTAYSSTEGWRQRLERRRRCTGMHQRPARRRRRCTAAHRRATKRPDDGAMKR